MRSNGRRGALLLKQGLCEHLHELLDRLAEAESEIGSINEILASRLGDIVQNDLLTLFLEFSGKGKSISPTFQFWNDSLATIML